jgi:polyphosphate kinase
LNPVDGRDMPRIKKTPVKPAQVAPAIDFADSRYYLNRELSWIEFNQRILHEATDPRTPLLEQVRYLANFCSNLDDFFMVRIADLKQQFASGTPRKSPDRSTPADQLQAITTKLRPLVAQHHQYFEQTLRPQLATNGVHILNYTSLHPDQQQALKQHFETNIFPILTPLAIDPSHPFPHISNLSLNFLVVVRDDETRRTRLARVKVPRLLPRFAVLPPPYPDPAIHWAGIPIEQLIAHHLPLLFSGMTVAAHYLFRITRNAAFTLEEADDLAQAVEQELRKRRVGATALRLELQSDTPAPLRTLLMRELNLAEADIYDTNGLTCLSDLRTLTTLPLPDLKYPTWVPVLPPDLRRASQHSADNPDSEDIFAAIRRHDILLHHPYHSFTGSVQLFISQAAADPAVLAIKMTIYRTSADLAILNTLITAAENGKQVAVLVELQARFEEANNVRWARRLEQSGVHVVYGLVGLKTHAKAILVVRQEGETIRRYVHIGTGDYNPRTARIYTDVGLLTCREEIGTDLSALFNALTGYSRRTSYRKLLVAPVNLRSSFMHLIQREIQHSQQHRHARIVAQMNALLDPEIIQTLYVASQAGVKIDLIVQSMCCLRPGVPGISENIRVISSVGRFLEHARIFYFHNGGQPEVYLGSADWMRRNLDRRVEVLVPVEDVDLSQDLQAILGTLLADNRHNWDLQPTGDYTQRQPLSDEAEINAQKIFMELAN